MTTSRYRPDDYLSREIDLLRDEIKEIRGQVNTIDNNGTRGTIAKSGVIEQKILELTSDVAELKTEFRQYLKDKVVSRRWLIGMGFTVAGVVIAILTLLVTALQHVIHP